jgi:site-specific DNA recombinase
MSIRCAIYTRKSTEEVKNQEVNIPDIQQQRSTCEHYILAQADNGWEVVEKHCDDGGYSGENMDRPGLQELLYDVEAGLVNCVVVHKIDRLTRSLPDFAKIARLFDKHGVRLTSVTQSFDTSNSMDRLMLNVLLGFGQYEQEIAGNYEIAD